MQTRSAAQAKQKSWFGILESIGVLMGDWTVYKECMRKFCSMSQAQNVNLQSDSIVLDKSDTHCYRVSGVSVPFGLGRGLEIQDAIPAGIMPALDSLQ